MIIAHNMRCISRYTANRSVCTDDTYTTDVLDVQYSIAWTQHLSIKITVYNAILGSFFYKIYIPRLYDILYIDVKIVYLLHITKASYWRLLLFPIGHAGSHFYGTPFVAKLCTSSNNCNLKIE